jgi:FlaA1/EpsC-like NDP-sugar epimerase
VIPTFLRQINNGGPVTVTDPRMTRFFMSIREAVQLVLQAAAMSEGRDIFVLEMGEQVRILDLARRMIRLSGRRVDDDVSIKLTGIRPGEKLVEELHAEAEVLEPTSHPVVRRLRPAIMMPAELNAVIRRLAEAAGAGRDRNVREELFRLTRDSDRDGSTRGDQVAVVG